MLHDGSLGTTPDGGLTLLGGGQLTLSGANTYTGPTTVSAGTLSLAQADLYDASNVFIKSGGSST